MNRIKELRQLKGWRQEDLAGKLNIGANSVSRYENGKHDLDTVMINKLCDIFGCTADYLLGRTDEPTAQLPQGKELKTELMRMLDELAPEDEALVKAFVAGLKASKK